MRNWQYFLSCLVVVLFVTWSWQQSSIPLHNLFTSTVSEPTKPTYSPQPATANVIFDFNDSWTATLSAQQTTTIMVTGDVLLARAVNHRMQQDNNWLWPWKNVASQLKSADYTVVNLENPFLDSCQPTLQGMIFCGNPQAVQGLNYAGVDLASLANNHALNQGFTGWQQTVQTLKDHDVQPLGLTSQPVTTTHQQQKIAWLAYTDLGVTNANQQPLISAAQVETIQQEIEQAQEEASLVIVFFHWGNEYTSQPSQRQRQLAHASIKAGADLVIGNHPHWVQSLEWYQGKLIVYSHGNFIFDQMWSQETKQGMVGKYTFYDDVLVDAVFLPIQIEDYGQPFFLSGEKADQRQQHLKQISQELLDLN